VNEDRVEEEASVRAESYIAELRRPRAVVVLPTRPPATLANCEALSQNAFELASAGEADRARRAAGDALAIASALRHGVAATMRANVARAMLVNGAASLLLSEMHRAAESFELAKAFYDVLLDLRGAARARFGLARALRELHDPRARAVFEDAGEIFEALDDRTTVREIDRLLREMQAEIDESPRSFHSSGPLRLVRDRPT
jgi:hypothetical protein